MSNQAPSKKDNTLYFRHMGGAGQIVCIDCGYKEEIVSFLHGDYDAVVGHQCQSCGKFHALGSHSEQHHVININTSLVCSCGGKLSREEPVFCPQCKSKNVEYEVDIIT